ncbi:MAG TPA: VanZ family protein [Terriglobales bacterium]|nr:VanZ family protein [Terriglobales bacterium]
MSQASPGLPRARIGLDERLRYWAPVLAWMLVISMFSGQPFSAANTNNYIDPILRFFFPDITAAGFVLAHSIIRKLAHFIEFFVLGWLVYWALRRGRAPQWYAHWALQATLFALVFALLDELHQAFVPNRTGSLLDSGIDTAGAVTAQLARYGWYRWASARLNRRG